VLGDPATSAAAGPGGLLALTIDGLPVNVRVAGVVRRFPTIAAGAGGVIIADEATLASALDGQRPGQGFPDELWIATRHPASLRAALARPPLSQLSSTFRAAIQRRLRSAPLASDVLATLVAGTAVSGVLAVLGLLVALLGGVRDPGIQRDLEEQGVGPRGLRNELRLRLAIAGLGGALAGLVVAVVVTRLAVLTVGAAIAAAAPQPPLVTVAPVAALAAWTVAAIAAMAVAGWLATLRGGGGDA
jgi:hypothetical protein